MDTNTASASERNYGIDLLRILSMYMIVCLHVIGQGGLLYRNPEQLSTYYATWLVETAAFCAVDCFGLISGYVGVKSKFRPGRILELWLQVFFYTSILLLIGSLLHPEWLEGSDVIDSGNVILKCLLPVSWKTYWYFSAYFVLFFFMPFINRMVLSLKPRECGALFWISFASMSCLTMVPKIYNIDVLTLLGGFSFVWIAVLYVMGACLRCMNRKKRKAVWCIVIYAAMVFIAWIYKILMENHTWETIGEAKYGRLLVTYTAPTIMLCAFCLILIFERIRITNRAAAAAVKLIASGTFSVYIIHAHPLIWENVLKNAFSSFRKLKGAAIIPPILGSALWIFALCSLIDIGRRLIFRALHVRQFTDYLGGKLYSRIMKK